MLKIINNLLKNNNMPFNCQSWVTGILIYLSKIFLGPCSSGYGDFLCEERIEYVLHNTEFFVFLSVLFLFFCASIGALIGLIIKRSKNLRKNKKIAWR
jgi:hypothetical protein